MSDFRFTVVVGEIWLCPYGTQRTKPEEEQEDLVSENSPGCSGAAHWTILFSSEIKNY